MQALEDTDKQLTQVLDHVKSLAKTIDIPHICSLSDESKIQTLTYPGIYRIDIRTTGTSNDIASWIAALKAEWEDPEFAECKSPRFILKRIAAHHSLQEWIPLYLGKAKNVGNRVIGHINLDKNKSTYALKLKARPSMASRELRLHAIPLEVKNYDAIATALETALRNRFQPLVGKQ